MRTDRRFAIGALGSILAWSASAAAQTQPPPDTAEVAPSEVREPEPTSDKAEVTPSAPVPLVREAPSVPMAAPPQSLIPDGEVPKGPIAPAFAPAIPGIDYGGRLRGGLKAQSPTSPNKMNDIGQQMDADILVSGQVHRYVKWAASVTMSYTGVAGASSSIYVQPLDAYGHLALLPEFNVMMGRMLVIADRFAPGGPWGQDYLTYPGFFPLVAAPALPKSGPTGRDLGTTVWGALFGGHAKYYLGISNMNDPASHPVYSGRVQFSLLGVEPNFNQRTTYYGTKELIAFGVGAQYQKDGSVQQPPATPPVTDDYKFVTGDVTLEKNIGGAGTVSAIGAFSKFWGQYQAWKQSYLGEVGYLLPRTVGIGKPRLAVRYQGAKSPAPGAKTTYVIDAQVSYNIHAWFSRLMLGYRHGDTWLVATGSSQASNMLYLAFQIWDP